MTSRMRIAVGCVLLAGPLAAQPALSPGTRVRVTTVASIPVDSTERPLENHIGTVVSSSTIGFELESESARWRRMLLYSRVSRLDVSAGRPSHRLAGAVIGGILSGGAFVGTVCAFSNGSCNVGSNVGGFLAYYAVGAIPGVVVGSAMGGRRTGPERWRTVWVATPAVP